MVNGIHLRRARERCGTKIQGPTHAYMKTNNGRKSVKRHKIHEYIAIVMIIINISFYSIKMNIFRIAMLTKLL